MHLTHPNISFALFSLAPPVPLFSLGSGNAHKGFLGHAPEDFSCLRAHGKDCVHEKPTSSFVADVSHAADLATMGQIDVGRIVHQQHHRRGKGLLPGLLQVRLHQRRKGDIWLVKQTIQGLGLSPGVHVSGQRPQGILCQIASRFDSSSGSTQIVQLDAPKGSLDPALGIRHFLCIHPVFYHLVKCG